MNLSFCGCGFLGVYHLGACACLLDHAPSLVKSLHRIGGASAGALAASALLCGREKITKSLEFSYTLANEIRSKPLGAVTPGYNILDSVHRFLATELPVDANVTATDKLFISLSALNGRKNKIVYEYKSKEDLIKCLLATSYIPIYVGMKPPKILGKRYLDGGMTNNLIIFNEGRTISISPFSGKQDICPNDKVGNGLFIRLKKQNFQVNSRNILRMMDAFFPPSNKTLDEYYTKGYTDTKEFLIREKRYELYEDVTVPKETTV